MELLFLFIIFTILFGVFFKFFQKYVHYEYTPILLILGIILGYFFDKLGYIGVSLEHVAGIDGHSLLLIFIPLLIFESAFNADTYTFMKSIWQIILLAFPAVAITVILVSLVLMYVLGYSSIFNWGMALSLGSILAATDPVAVVAILSSTGAKIKLNMLIEGESLMNDGSAAIFFFVFQDMILTPGFSFVAFLQKFARLTLGGVALGFAVGIVSTPIMLSFSNDNLVVVFSFISAYLTFFLAEASIVKLHVSGILAVVILGLYLGATVKPKLNPHYIHTMHSVWHFGQFMMETILFLLTGAYIGVFIGEKDFTILGSDIWKMILFNFILLFIRFSVLALFWPLLNLVGYRITWKEYVLMGWAGLRGAIGLAIGLLVAFNKNYLERFRDLTIFYISGVILFTVLIQGTTMKFIMKLVRYNQMSTTKKKLYKDLKRRLFLNLLEKTETLRSNKEITFRVSWETIYDIFDFTKYILDINNIETKSKPLLLDYDYKHDTDFLVEHHNDKLDYLISDDEVHDEDDDEDDRNINSGLNLEYNSRRGIEIVDRDDSIYDSNDDQKNNFNIYDNNDEDDEGHETKTMNNIEEIKINYDHDESRATHIASRMASLKRKSQITQIKSSKGLSIKQRKKMLANVMKRLYEKTKEIQFKKERKVKEMEIIQEMRMRVYKILKNLVWEKFENNMCEGNTLVNLHRMIDICKDNLKIPLHCFDVYSKIYTATLTEKLLMKLKKLPLIGKLFLNKLVHKLYQRFDFLLMITITISEILESKKFLKEEFSDWKMIVNELRNELLNFEMNQDVLFQGNEKLTKIIQTKKVGKTIVNFGYNLIQKLNHSGEIDAGEKKQLVNYLLKCHNKLNKTETFVNKYHKELFKKENVLANSNDSDFNKKVQMREKDFHAEISYIFPILKELSREDLIRFREEIIKDKRNKNGYSIECSCSLKMNSDQEQGYVYLVKYGMFKIKSSTERLVKILGSNDLFGLAQLINNDISVIAEPNSKSQYYKVRLEFMHEIIGKYPNLEKNAYASAVYTYLKACPYSLALQKSKYFRRLRRISFYHLKKIFNKGTVKTFHSNDEIIDYISKEKYIYLGIFVLNGKIQLSHENFEETNLRRMTRLRSSRMMDVNENANNLVLDAFGNSEKYINDKDIDKKPLDRNLFSVRKIEHFNTKFEEDNTRVNIIADGNANEIYVDYLKSMNLISPKLTVFIIETNSHKNSYNNDLLGNKNKNAYNKINRKKYM